MDERRMEANAAERSVINEIKTELNKIHSKIDNKQPKIPISAVLGILAFMLTTVGVLFKTSYENEANFKVISEKIDYIERRMKDRYTATNAIADFALRDSEIEALESQRKEHEHDHKELEKRIYQLELNQSRKPWLDSE